MEKDDEYDPETENLSLGHARADALLKKYGSIENIPSFKEKKVEEDKEKDKENKLEKMALFVKSSDELHLDPNRLFDSFEGRQEKIKLIRKYKGVFDATSYYSPKLEKLFQNYYTSFKKKIAK